MKITRLHAENVHGYLLIDVGFYDDITFLTGLNGSGKTSALRLLMALLTPNIIELEAISFTLAELTVFDNGENIHILATKTPTEIRLKISRIEEELVINRSELDFIIDSKRSDELSPKVREKYNSNTVFQSILKMSTPMFLGLDRRFLVPRSTAEDFEEARRREYMVRRYWPEDSLSRTEATVPSHLLEINYLVVNRMQEIRASQEQLDETLRKEFFKKAFEYKPSGFLSSEMKMPSKKELESYRQQLSRIEQNAEGIKIPVPEIQAALTDFFEKMGQIVDSLEKNASKQKPTIPKDRSNYQNKKTEKLDRVIPDRAYVEWIVNKPQADRILEHLHLLNNYIEKHKSLRDPIVRFSTLVNGFLSQTRKKVIVGNNGQLTIQINGNAKDSRSISALSSGERQLLVMLAHLSFNPNLDGSGVFIVDEPELSLHIDWQEKFVDAVCEANPNVQIILATHSPAIILDRTDSCKNLRGDTHDQVA